MNSMFPLEDEFAEEVLPYLFDIDVDKARDLLKPIAYNGRGQKLAMGISEDGFVEIDPTKYLPRCNTFVHFTSIKTLFSILNEKAIRMYNLNNVEDTREMYHTMSKFNYCKEDIIEFKQGTYTLSMCEASVMGTDKEFELWKHYGENGNGIAIEFEIEVPNNYTVLSKVVYDEREFSLFRKAIKAFEEKHHIEVDIRPLLRILATVHKSSIYSYEQEVRLIYFEPFASTSYPGDWVSDDSDIYPDINRSNRQVTYKKVKIHSLSGFDRIIQPAIKIKSVTFGYKWEQEQIKELENKIKPMFLYIAEQVGQKYEPVQFRKSSLVV